MIPNMSSFATSFFGRLSSIPNTQGRLPVARYYLQFVHNHGILEPALACYAKSDISSNMKVQALSQKRYVSRLPCVGRGAADRGT